ncbi:SAM-dependent methyltransferase [Umboniibacter marinipuniceus]|uniref:Cyclopropane-fatty-acyl-phospholipid synthase n=1 Tax=Umboniibacter marinipuniceus TaxID=569599 RepID=A0A3M0AU31_9GAMM|nr:cyclopropane-fatty-acyl-phospholipid synthase family protein [Umboniibacter marinipuniceus]RMA82452.1 cyclopropane-fatty-acyl-phospholipid synthase [Umboniibacter marinipuniceus]
MKAATRNADSTSPKLSWTQRLVFSNLNQLAGAHLTLCDRGNTRCFGEESATLKATINVNHPRFYTDLVLGGTIGAGESYMAGDWETPDLTAVIQVMARNLGITSRLDAGLAKLIKPLNKFYHWRNRNTERQARNNIARHYDLGNDFFQTFLDPTMSYSAAVFAKDEATMEAASLAKFAAMAHQLELKPEDSLVEIGTGWGGFAIYAAEKIGCHVTTTTISEEQYAYTQAQIKARGLESKITLLKDDYRALQGKFDKLASIEMIEAVGWQYLDTYFGTLKRLLKPGGKAVIQAITIPEDRYESAKTDVDFIQKYIFPGGFLPSVSAISTHAGAQGLYLSHYYDFGLGYAQTLANWRERFEENLAVIKAQGLSDTFINMWRFYFSYCEGGFREKKIGVGHFTFTN